MILFNRRCLQRRNDPTLRNQERDAAFAELTISLRLERGNSAITGL